MRRGIGPVIGAEGTEAPKLGAAARRGRLDRVVVLTQAARIGAELGWPTTVPGYRDRIEID